jgi:hypothetical protein
MDGMTAAQAIRKLEFDAPHRKISIIF